MLRERQQKKRVCRGGREKEVDSAGGEEVLREREKKMEKKHGMMDGR